MTENTTDRDKEFLEYVIKALVDNPGDVKVDRTIDEMGVLLTLLVSPADMGKIIGRKGNTAKAIRTLLRVVGMKNNARVNMKINEPEGSTHVFGGTPVSSSAPRPSAADVDSAMDEIKDL
ncbi:MAG: KH domain-containing protein [Patescibacteria group bacterium]